MAWICTGCGERYEVRDPPCLECAGEEFAEVAEATDRTFETGVRVEDAGDDASESATDAPEFDSAFAPPKSTDTGSQTLYYGGVVLGVIGVVTLPFFFFLIALPESIARMRGTTTQKYFPAGARSNPAVSGSMLVMGWFGNFLVLMFVLGFVVGLLLLAA